MGILGHLKQLSCPVTDVVKLLGNANFHPPVSLLKVQGRGDDDFASEFREKYSDPWHCAVSVTHEVVVTMTSNSTGGVGG